MFVFFQIKFSGGYTRVSHRWWRENGFRCFLLTEGTLWKAHKAVCMLIPTCRGSSAKSPSQSNSQGVNAPERKTKSGVEEHSCACHFIQHQRCKESLERASNIFHMSQEIRILQCDNEALSRSQSAFYFYFKGEEQFDHSWEIPETKQNKKSRHQLRRTEHWWVLMKPAYAAFFFFFFLNWTKQAWSSS